MLYQNRSLLVRHSLILALLALTGVFAGIHRLDVLIADFFARPELQKVYYYSREVTNIGDSVHYFVLALLVLIFSKLLYPRIGFLQRSVSRTKTQLAAGWSIFLLKALIGCGLVLHILKFCIGRQRPHVSADFHNMNFEPFNFHHHWQSLPSGHTQVLFTVATVAMLIWPKFRFLFFTLAAVFAFTRVTIHQHFFSDVVAGALVGYLVTVWMYHLWPPRTKL